MKTYLSVAALLLGMLSVWLMARSTFAADVAASAAKVGETERRLCQNRQTKVEEEITRLSALVPPQSVAMLAAAQQFANLSLAAKQLNWPLAQFFLEETVEGIEWAVRIEPTRKDTAGRTVDLRAIFESLENSAVRELKAASEAHDLDRFQVGYRHMLEGCYACHKAVGKPYLRPRVPGDTAATAVLNFAPEAVWPQ